MGWRLRVFLPAHHLLLRKPRSQPMSWPQVQATVCKGVRHLLVTDEY